MTAATQDRRKTLVILPAMQRRFIMRAWLVPVGALLLLGAAIAIHCTRVVNEAAANDVDLPGLRFLLPAVLAFVFAMAGLMFRQATLFSNRVGGPAYRIVQSMRQLRAGELKGPVRLRNGDYLQEVVDELNELVTWVEKSRPVDGETAAAADDDDEPMDADVELPTREIGAGAS